MNTLTDRLQIRVILVNPNQLIYPRLRGILASTLDIAFLGETAAYTEVLTTCGPLRPDMLLILIDWCDKTALTLIQAISERWPEQRLVIICPKPNVTLTLSTFAAGVRGFLICDVAREDLLSVLWMVLRGGIAICPTTTSAMSTQISVYKGLSQRQEQVVVQVAAGTLQRRDRHRAEDQPQDGRRSSPADLCEN